MALEQGGRKWAVENHTGNRDLVLDNVDAKQAVYIYNCKDCTIQVSQLSSLCCWAQGSEPICTSKTLER